MKWLAGLLVLAAAMSAGEAWARKDALLNVAGGQIPDDTGSDGATKMTIEDKAQLGGKALKVVFAPGDSFGVRSSKVRNWKPYITLEFEVFNPEKGDVGLQFNVRHKRSTSYQTRVEHGFTVKPGKNSIKIGLDEMANVNGSVPDFSDAQRWYINPTDGKSPTLYFGDIFLVGDDAAQAPAAAPAAGGGPVVTGFSGSYRVTGKVGDMNVDLNVQPVGGTVQAAPGAGPAPAKSEAQAAALLRPSLEQLPNDTGSDQTKLSIEDRPELDGKCLKVIYAGADSFGQSRVKVKDWKPFLTIQFDMFNPGKTDVRMALNVKHKRSTNYQTRIEVLFVAKPGKNAIKFNLDEMVNVNGSAADLTLVTHWFILTQDEKAPPLYFGDVWLVPAGGTVPAPGVAESGPSKPVATDPARLARIRAARMPPITRPVMFNTPEADAILTALEVFPPDNPWNQLVEDWPLHPNSKNIIASIGADKPFRYNADMAFILVPPHQKRIELKELDAQAESDKGPYPIPDNLPIENWPVGYQGMTLDDVQRDKANIGGDRHGIIVDPVNRMLCEFWLTKKVAGGWVANQASIFDLKTNKLRPDGWTSADAAGLPIFPAVVRYDELKRGVIDHAVRVSVVKTRRDYAAPATHYASPHTNEEYPRMGERIRLRRDFDISGFSPNAQVILKALKRYGMFVADNGIDWAISVAPDERIPVMHAELRKLKGSDFEVVTAP
jgi:hypothetical protein